MGVSLISAEVVWWSKVSFGNSNLATIRISEAYAWLAIIFLATALLVGPAYKLTPRLPGKRLMSDARRLCGVGSAWFATLHSAISYFSLFKGSLNPLALPITYAKAFLLGFLALMILLVMAFTSFDAAFTKLGKWWFRTHRLVYAAGILTIIHAYMIGSHADTTAGLIILSAAGLVILTLHIAVTKQTKRYTWWHLLTITTAAALLLFAIRYGYHQHKNAFYFEKVRPGGPLR